MRWFALPIVWALTTATAHTQEGRKSYDGRVMVARIRFELNNLGGCNLSDSPGGPGWGHDYPMSVQGLMGAANRLMRMETLDSTVTLTVNDPEFMKYPVAMITEPGCWTPTDEEIKTIRSYLLKGGFLIIDDLTLSRDDQGSQTIAITHFETWMKRVLPDAKLIRIGESDPIFHKLFGLNPGDVPGLSGRDRGGEVYAIYQDNDSTKRIMLIANYHVRIGENWRNAKGLGSGLGTGAGARAYKLGLNYLVYSLSH